MAEQCCTQAVNVLLKFIRYRRTSRLAPLFNHILLPKSNDKVVAEICIVEYTMTTVAHAKNTRFQSLPETSPALKTQTPR